MTGDSVILSMKGINKSFDGNLALDNVNFYLNAREIHGLLGGNGAGKTTLMNVLYGLYRMDSGEILLHDRPIQINSPKEAIQHRIGMVHQHFLQVNTYQVIENIILGTKVKRALDMNLTFETEHIHELMERFKIKVDLHAPINTLPMGTRQKVEILKALYRGVEILILDEPTTNLTPQEVDDLFQTLRTMVTAGLSIVFITHKLREVLSVCDRISVLRNGQNVVTLRRGEASEDDFVQAMVGSDVDLQQSVIFTKGMTGSEVRTVGNEVVLDVQEIGLTTKDGIQILKDISFQAHCGEIFGIAGVAGNGQRDLAEVIMGIQKPSTGQITFMGVSNKQSTGDLLASGFTYIPEDRLEDGFLPKANVAQNIILGSHDREPYSRKGFIDWGNIYTITRALIKEYNIKTSGPEEIAGNLSGGNIQRTMIARAFSQPSKLMVAHNPTRGLDIPSMDFVYKKMFEAKSTQVAVVLISEDLDELLLMSDRLGVMYRGELVGILTRDHYEKYQIGRMMSGVRTDS
jgi:general nucleoside transport system ATP-binding protein